jgi:folate-dependent tRNA-U54 methylase TrmFO/GidA
MKANFGILPELERRIKNKRERYQAYAERALHDLRISVDGLQDPYLKPVALEV